ncbi:MAG: hypothetical protein ACYS15_12200 [Planctomycetota bacterium]
MSPRRREPPRDFPASCRVVVLLLSVLVVLGGCARTVLESSVVDVAAADEAELDFWEGVEGQRIVTVNDALHALLLLADGSDPFATYDERLAEAKRRKWLPAEADPAANESATVGQVAMAACQILDVKGGLTMRVLGPSPRYCTRELVFLGILPPRTEHQSLSGLELMDVVGRVEDRLGEPVGPDSED